MSTADRDFDLLVRAQYAAGRFICMGLDPVYERIPLSVPGRFEGEDAEYLEQAIAFYNFCVKIVDATCDIVAAYKPNTAFFEAAGEHGYAMLRMLIRHIHRVAPHVLVIIDGKRADIGKTNVGTAKFIFDNLAGDALTVNPYFGEEALEPFLNRPGKGVVVLCRTSNPGAGEFQNVMVSVPEAELVAMGLDPVDWQRMPLYQYVALRVRQWKTKGSIQVVVGATAPEELKEVRLILPETTILIPGVGIQGGSLEEAVRFGRTLERVGILLNAGSQALYASSEESYPDDTRAAVITMNTGAREVLAA